jgi:ring-1,2-phenylacetyl-CoA epoxidase subunit PaaB
VKQETEFPRYQVFLQERDGQPHQDVGSVHAPDAEMALFNARDVFVRRPECVSLWVVPADAIYTRTAQEIEEKGITDSQSASETKQSDAHLVADSFYIFCKAKAAGTHILVGRFQAASPGEALQQAWEVDRHAQPPFSWWVVPARLVTTSLPGDLESMFFPALDKPFRLSTDFHTLTELRRIKKAREK